MRLRSARWLRLARRVGLAAALAAMFLTLAAFPSQGNAGGPQDGGQPPKAKDDPAKTATPPKDDAQKKPAVKLGLALNDPKALQGYTLLAPLSSTKTYLLDMQ